MSALDADEAEGGPVAEGAVSLPFWVAIVLIGLAAGLAGGVLMRLLYVVQGVAWAQAGDGLYQAARAAGPVRKIAVLAIAGAVVAAGVAALRFVRGGHSGDLVETIHKHDGFMPALRTAGSALLSIVVVGLGAPVGREGALKQVGAVAGWQVAHRFRLDADQRRILTACGAGAGLAAAYNIPLGGAVFALEVLLQTTAWPVAVPAIACTAIATAASWLLLPMRPLYATPAYALNLDLVGWALIAGPIIGLAGIAFVRLIAWADAKATMSAAVRTAVLLALFAAIGAIAIAWPEMVGNGKDVVQLAFDGGGGDPRLASVTVLLGLAIVRALATACCLKAGVPGGLFTPTLTSGALIGAALGHLWSGWFPGTAPGSYAAIGSAALVAASTGGPISAIVMVLELGQHVDALTAPIVVAVAGACLVMRIARSPSIYTVRL